MEKISFCMIMKNEEKTLERMFQSIQGKVDEIIVVDTGSTDNSVEIAKRYTDNVYFFEWCDDFSKARNESLKYATGDWIFFLDADEFLDESVDLHQIVEGNKEYEAFCFIMQELDQEGKISGTIISSERLFKKGKKFKNAVHENITPLFPEKVKKLDAIFYHTGYNKSKPELEAKYRRNEKLLKKRLKSEGETFEILSYLFKTYVMRDKYQKAIRIFEKLEKKYGRQLTSSLYFTRGYLSFLMGKINGSDRYFFKAIEKDKKNPDPYLFLGFFNYKKNNFQKAFSFLNNYLDIIKTGNVSNVEYETLGKVDEALYVIAEIVLGSGNISLLERYLEDIRNLKTYKSAFILGNYFELKGDLDKALTYYMQAYEENKNDGRLLNSIGVLFVKRNEIEKGMEFLEKAISVSSPDLRAFDNLATIYEKVLGDSEKAKEILREKGKRR